MGQAAAMAADLVYVTDDNPRSEEPAAIRRAILAAAPQYVEATGVRAFFASIAALRPATMLIIAGKGHETGQIVGREVLPFDDAAIAAEEIAGRTPS